jgi:hypothetical protein
MHPQKHRQENRRREDYRHSAAWNALRVCVRDIFVIQGLEHDEMRPGRDAHARASGQRRMTKQNERTQGGHATLRSAACVPA